ncbi:hypothetical protein D7V82_19040 [bacterium 1xD8-6]|jgi:hypothetical protein|nr:hypothetical protein D7V72_16145 [bacterium D16-36]RKI64037.1 hypothetical protein D7V82_19040 [bacterium 1xD8-6]
MTGQQYRITDLDGCFDIAWSCINYNDMIQIIRRLVKRESTKIQYAVSLLIYEAKTSSELYSAVVKCAEEFNAFKFVDDLWDEIVELPWAQLYRINKVTCIPCSHSMNCFG